MSNIINTNGNLGILRNNVQVMTPVNQYGSNAYDGQEILNVNNIGQLKSQVILLCPVDENGNALL